MKISIPSQLHSYTGGVAAVEGEGASLAEMLVWLDARYPGLKFRIVDEQDRIRPHIKFFVGGRLARDIGHPVGPDDTVKIVGALSGG